MLNFAIVIMIVAGLFGLPAAVCSGVCAGVTSAAPVDPQYGTGASVVKGYTQTFMWISVIASFGSIIAGALTKKLGKVVSGTCALIFSALFASLLLQMNAFGMLSSIMLLIAGVMIFVAPTDQFSGR